MRTCIRRDAPALAQDRREDGRKQTSVFACEAWSFALVRRPKHNEFPHIHPCTEARIPRQGYPYLNRLPIFMTQARAPTPHEVAAKSPITDHLPGAVREKYSAQQARQHRLLTGVRDRYGTKHSAPCMPLASPSVRSSGARRPPPAMHLANTPAYRVRAS